MIIRVIWLGLARTVSFHPLSCGSGGIAGPVYWMIFSLLYFSTSKSLRSKI